MKVHSESFLKNLEEAVLEHRKLACPNVDCNDMIVSRELVNEDSTSEIHYWCRSHSCTYHHKRSISSNSHSGMPMPTEKTGKGLISAYNKVEKRSFSFLAYFMMIPVALIAIMRDILERLE